MISVQASKRLRWVTYSVDKERRTEYKTVNEGKRRSRSWKALVGCVSFSGAPAEAGSEAWGLEQRGKSEGATKRHMGLDTEREEALGAWYWLQHQRTTSDLSFCQDSWLAANWVKHCLYRNPRELNRELGSAPRASCSESLVQPNCWAWGQAAVECHRYNKSLSTPWKKTQSPQLFSLLWPMAIKLHTRTEPHGVLKCFMLLLFLTFKKKKSKSNSYKNSLEIWKICSPGTERHLNPAKFPQVLSLMV